MVAAWSGAETLALPFQQSEAVVLLSSLMQKNSEKTEGIKMLLQEKGFDFEFLANNLPFIAGNRERHNLGIKQKNISAIMIPLNSDRNSWLHALSQTVGEVRLGVNDQRMSSLLQAFGINLEEARDLSELRVAGIPIKIEGIKNSSFAIAAVSLLPEKFLEESFWGFKDQRKIVISLPVGKGIPQDGSFVFLSFSHEKGCLVLKQLPAEDEGAKITDDPQTVFAQLHFQPIPEPKW